MKASGAIILSRARNKGKTAQPSIADELTCNLHVKDAEVEQKKYNNFWVGIQRRVALQQTRSNVMAVSNCATRKAKKNKKKKKMIIHPLNDHKVTWDLFICALVVYCVVVIPVRIGFSKAPSTGFLVLDRLIDCLFGIDMALTFNTAYFDRHAEVYVFSRRQIASNYLKFWFWVDLISTVPIDDLVLLWFRNSSGNYGAVRAIRILRLGRLAKLQRVTKLSDYLEENLGIGPSQINLVMLLLQIFFVAHLFACFWHYLAMQADSSQRTWMTEGSFDRESDTNQYVASLYYTIVTMLTVGYGDIHPTNSSERAYSVFTMLSGGVIFGALLSKVASVIEKRHPQARAFKDSMDELRAFLDEYSVPLSVKIKAKEAYSYYLTKKSSFGESGIFQDLPQPLLFKLVLQLYEKDIKKVKMFCTYECSFVVTLVTNCKPFQAAHGEILFQQGDVCKELVFLPAGMVRLSIATGSGKNILCGFCTEGGYFGDMEFYRNSVITLAQYSAVCDCELLSVSYSVLRQAFGESLDSGVSFNQEVTKRYAAFMRVTKTAVTGELHNRRSLRSHVGGMIQQTPRSLFGVPSIQSAATRMRYSRRISTSAHASIWVNGHVRDHRESAHYVRMALLRSSDTVAAALSKRSSRDSSTNLSDLGKLSARDESRENSFAGAEGSGAGTLKQADSTDSMLTLLENTETERDTTCRVLTRDEDGTLLIGDISHRQLRQMYLIDPKEKWKVQWDLFLAVIIVYTVLMTPVDLAFYSGEETHDTAVELVLDGIFFMDLTFSFRTSYPSSHEGALVLDQWLIAGNYLRSWFLVDLLSSIPFQLVFRGVLASEGLKSVKLIKALRLFRLLKLTRILKLEVIMGHMEDSLGLPRSIFELLQVLVEVFFIGHLVACLWWGMSASLSDSPWFTNPDMVYKDLSKAPVHEKYLFSLYFTFTTMTTVGYGDISATNPGERVLNIFIIVLGASVFGYIIANVSTILESFSRVDAVQSSRIVVIKEYLREKACPEALEAKVVSHFKHLFSITSAYDVNKIMARLPASLRDDILYFHNEIKMKHIPIFRYLPSRSMALHVFNLLTPTFFETDQYIIRQGAESAEISFLVVGTACAFKVNEPKHVQPKKTGRARGRLDLFSNMNSDEAQAYRQARATFTSPSGAAVTTDTDGGEDYEPGWDPAEATAADGERGDAKDSVEQPQLPRLRLPQLSSEHRTSASSMIRAFADSSKQTSPLNSFVQQHFRSSFSAHSALDSVLGEANGKAQQGSADLNLPKLNNFHALDDTEKEMQGLRLIGDFNAGDFFGYASLMKHATNEFSLVATAPCTVFVLSKTTIYKLIHAEPVVGLRLQEALGSAISAQAASLGQSHRRHNRAEFLRDLKDKVCELHQLGTGSKNSTAGWGSTGKTLPKANVKRALEAVAAERERSSKQPNSFFSGGSHGALSPDKNSTGGVQQPRRVAEGMSRRVTLVKNARRFQSLRRRFSYKAEITPIQEVNEDLAAPSVEQRNKPVVTTAATDATKRLKKLDHLLNDQTMLYDSEDEDPRRAAQEQAVAQMQELVRHTRLEGLPAETPRQKLQRLLRKAVRQYRRRKAREDFQRRTVSYSNLTVVAKHSSFAASMRLRSFHDDSLVGLSSRGVGMTAASGTAARGRTRGPLLSAPTATATAKESHWKSSRPDSLSAPSMLLSTQKSTWRSSLQGVSLGLRSISTLRQHTASRPTHTFLTRYGMCQIKKAVDRNRRWSYGSMESILLATSWRTSPAQSPTEEELAASLGQDSQQRHFVAVRTRRQSFPSLDNAEWRDHLSYQAVL